MSIEIRHYEPNTTGEGKALGFFTVYNTKSTELKNFFSIVESNGKRWVSPPSRKKESGGEARYIPYAVYENKEYQEKFLKAVMVALEKYWDANPHHSPNMMMPPEGKRLECTPDDQLPF